MSPSRVALISVVVAVLAVSPAASSEHENGSYEQLLGLFEQWRELEGRLDPAGVPDYTAANMSRLHEQLGELQLRLEAIDPNAWPIEQQVDYHLVRAEMNGLDFNIRVLRPWERDPAFYVSVWRYQSDTPAHEGPNHHALVELWQYEMPLSGADAERLVGELGTIPPLLEQARINLTGNARELWEAGIGSIRGQTEALEEFASSVPDSEAGLLKAIAEARRATLSFTSWLEHEAPTKTGPSGIGKENYTWYLQNVHLVPLTWEDEVRLLRRELDRAHASLRLEEQRNRNLPPLVAISSPEEYDRRANEAVDKYLEFLESEEIMPIHDYMDPALRAQIGSFRPEAERNFFSTAIHYEPMTLWTHFYHWWDLARMEENPHSSPIRRGPLLYNIFDSRAEGMSTGVEEMMMHAGLYDDNPRVREIVWIMLAQRAARGLGSLYVHSNDFTMKEARDFHVAWTPRGWMREDLDLLGFEQQLYLRQPGYGTSYVTGKYLVEKLLAERSRQLGEAFTLSGFFEEVDACGVIPMSLIRWQLTGDGDEVRQMTESPAGVDGSEPLFGAPREHLLSSSFIDQEYRIDVALPYTYDGSDQRYPVLYLLDSDVLFGTVTEISRLMPLEGIPEFLGERRVPELIVVGIGYPGGVAEMSGKRGRDYNPPEGESGEVNPRGSADFYRFLSEDLIPFIEATYRADAGDRSLAGASRGGIFVLGTLFQHPETFRRYLALSPTIEPPVYDYEAAWAEKPQALAGRLVLSAGSAGAIEKGISDNVSRLAEQLEARDYPGLEWSLLTFPDESHVSVVPRALVEGLVAIYAEP